MEFRNSRYAALAATLPGCDDLTLGQYKLLAGLYLLLRAEPKKILAWAYFQPAFGLTPAQARRRVGDLEARGLLERRDVDFRRAGGPAGSRYRLTDAGTRVVKLASPLFAKAGEGRAPMPDPATATQEPLAAMAALQQDRAPHTPRIALSELPAPVHHAILRLPAAAARYVARTLTEGTSVDREAAARDGVPEPEKTCALVAQIRAKFASEDLKASNDAASAASEALTTAGENVRRRTSAGDPTLVRAAGAEALEGARAAGVEVPEVAPGSVPDDTLLTVGQLAIAEAAARYQPLLARLSDFQERLPELAWSVTEGSFADSGSLVRRVRAVLSLMARGRWSRPRGYRPEFKQRWQAAVCVA